MSTVKLTNKAHPAIQQFEAKLPPLERLSNNEKYTAWLLLLNLDQFKIAEIVGLSRTRISQLIRSANIKFGISSWSEKTLIDYCIKNNLHKTIPPKFVNILIDLISVKDADNEVNV